MRNVQVPFVYLQKIFPLLLDFSSLTIFIFFKLVVTGFAVFFTLKFFGWLYGIHSWTSVLLVCPWPWSLIPSCSCSSSRWRHLHLLYLFLIKNKAIKYIHLTLYTTLACSMTSGKNCVAFVLISDFDPGLFRKVFFFFFLFPLWLSG